MIKDYIYVETNEGPSKNENAFIEKHWSDLWRDKELKFQAVNDVIEPRMELAVMQRYLQEPGSSKKILDAGCGLGDWTVYFALKGHETIGLDISEEIILRLQKIDAPGVYRHGDIRDTGFPDNHFDICFSWGVFEHFEKGPDDCFQEAFRILKPGGYLFVSVPYQNLRHVRQMNMPMKQNNENSQATLDSSKRMRFYQWRLSEGELFQQAFMAGFEAKEIHRLDKREGVRRIMAGSYPNLKGRFRNITESILCCLLPARWVSHMIMVVAIKPIS